MEKASTVWNEYHAFVNTITLGLCTCLHCLLGMGFMVLQLQEMHGSKPEKSIFEISELYGKNLEQQLRVWWDMWLKKPQILCPADISHATLMCIFKQLLGRLQGGPHQCVYVTRALFVNYEVFLVLSGFPKYGKDDYYL